MTELDERGIPAGGRVEQVEGTLGDPRARRLFRNLVLEVQRHRLRLDTVLDRFLDRRTVGDLPPPIRNALRLGLAQLLLLDGIPPHAAVDTSVALARRHGHAGTAGLVNAVLRRAVREGRARWNEAGAPPPDGAEESAEEKATRLAVRHSHPVWLVRRWLALWGVERTERVLTWNNTHPDYWLRLRDPAAEPPEGTTAGWIPRTARLPAGGRPGALPGLAAGEIAVQDGSGILVGWIPPAVEGLVINLCAAPGTKAGHLLDRSAGRPGGPSDARDAGTTIVALDLSSGRLGRMRRGLRSSDAGRILLVAADARDIPIRPPWRGALVDAPCSNLGVVRRRVDIKWRARPEEIPRLAGTQAELLRAAAAGIGPAGWLVYSVCTLEPEETVAQRDRFLEEQAAWEPAPLPRLIPEGARAREGEMILIPGEHDTDGTYACHFRRRM